MKDKRVVVTGATRGIGRETALALARMGAHVILVVRDERRGHELAGELRDAGAAAAEVFVADFASLREVDRAGKAIAETHPKLDVLVNNAGAIFMDRLVTKDGYEMSFGANHLAPFHLTSVLLPSLEAAPSARVVVVASEAHRRGTIDFGDLMHEKRYRGLPAYSASKLANILFASHLAKRLAGTRVTSNSLHPGVIRSSFAQNNRGVVALFFKYAPFLLDEKGGARTSIWAASSPEVEGVTGKYFKRCREARPTREARDAAVAARLWDVSDDLVRRALAKG